jgi:hypothetical protein
MAKRIIFFILQFFAFLGLLDVGGNWDVIRFAQQIKAMQQGTTAFNPIPVFKTPLGTHHILILNGLFFAGALFVLILLFEAIRRRLRPWAGITAVAFILAIGAAVVLKFGLPPA